MLDTPAAVRCHAKRDAHARCTVRNACVRALAVCALLTSGAAMEPRAGPDLGDVADVLRSWQASPLCNELGQLGGGALRMLCNGDQCQLIDMVAQGLVTGLACDHLTIVPRPPPKPSSPPPPEKISEFTTEISFCELGIFFCQKKRHHFFRKFAICWLPGPPKKCSNRPAS